MKVAIVAGGKGTRIAAEWPNIPKPMVPLCGKPVLQWQVEELVSQGFCDITMMVGYKAEYITAHFGDGSKFGANISYIHEKDPLGTGGALSMLPKEDTLLLMGDVFFQVELPRFAAFHQEHSAGITLFTHPNSHPQDSSVVVAGDEGRVTAWLPKEAARRTPPRNLVCASLYLLSAGALPSSPPKRLDLDRDIVAGRIPRGDVFAYRSTEYVKDMGTPQRLEAVERDVQNGVSEARRLTHRQRAIFLDRDGTLNEPNGFIARPEDLRLVGGAKEAVALINRSPYLAICVTNQPVIARGEATLAGLEAVHGQLDALLAEGGAYLDDLLFCPHHPDRGFPGEAPEYKVDCACRKPKPGLLLTAAERYNIDLSESWMVGDTEADMQAGRAAGCRCIRVGQKSTAPGRAQCDILEAVQSILSGQG